MPYKSREDKHGAEVRLGVTPGSYKFNQRHHVGSAGSKFYLNKLRYRLALRIKTKETKIRLLEREIEKLSAKG